MACYARGGPLPALTEHPAAPCLGQWNITAGLYV